MLLPSVHRIKVLFAIFLIINSNLLALQFKVVERRIVGEEAFYLTRIVEGVELYNDSPHRLKIKSENQSNYPIPKSGCGPTSMLSILMWYENYGIIKSLYRDTDLRSYKLNLFREIDNHLFRQAGVNGGEHVGVTLLDTAVTMDFMFEMRSKGTTRIHTEFKPGPLKTRDFLRTTLNFRSGLLIVRPKDLQTGELGNLHATVIIEADERGRITLGTWGQLYCGLLEERPGGQWFVPQDPSHMELKIRELILFMPFQPTSKF